MLHRNKATALLMIVGAFVSLVGGCGFVGVGSNDGGTSAVDAPTDASADVMPLDALTDVQRSIDVGVDVAEMDAGIDASDATVDAGMDAGPVGPPCPSVDGDTTFLFEMGDNTDTVGGRAASVTGTGAFVTIPEAPCAGDVFQGGAAGVLIMTNDEAFELAIGALDVWLYLPASAMGTSKGLISRDAAGTMFPNHFFIGLAEESRIAIRWQGIETQPSMWLCSDVFVEADFGRWMHLGVNFGNDGIELWIDGERHTGTGEASFVGRGRMGGTCGMGTDRPAGTNGNGNPFVLGADTHESMEGTADIFDMYASGVQFDHFRLSSAQRDFSLYRL